MVTATFRFHEDLHHFLARERRGKEFSCICAESATTKHMIEALGVPHTEVGRLTVNHEPAGLAHLIEEGDCVEVYPGPAWIDENMALDLPPAAPEKRFVADAHLGGLAHLLRMAGFDTLYDNNFQDGEIEAISAREMRIVLTRDRELLKRRGVLCGCYVRSLKPELQLRELFARFDLAPGVRPFSLCLHCNAPLRAIDKMLVQDRIPPAVRRDQHEFSTCDICQRVFWKGSHWRRMQAMLADLLPLLFDRRTPSSS